MVKFTIVSAGRGDVIRGCLEELPGYAAVEIYSNFIDFDAEGMSTGFKSPLLHSLSKPRALVAKQLKKNLLVLGDMPHDMLMVSHYEQSHVLSVGYCNDETVFDLANYTNIYDG
jgi:hypothetical protein